MTIFIAVTGWYENIAFDIVHLRNEHYTSTSRVPAVQHGGPLEDALRRDLTINSLFYNLHTREIEDYTQKGFEDLKRGLVRTPLAALTTLMDDPLRAFRAVRFASRFIFTMDPDLVRACSNPVVLDSLAMKISQERFTNELFRMITGHAAVEAICRLQKFGLLDFLIKIPSTLTQKRELVNKKTRRLVTDNIPVEPIKLQQLQSQLFPMAMSTLMIAHYMRKVCEDKELVWIPRSDAIGKLANHQIGIESVPRTSAFLKWVNNRDAAWEVFT